MTAGEKLLESEQMDCRGAGVVQTTSWALMAVVASMASDGSNGSNGFDVGFDGSDGVDGGGFDLMAPELKSERERMREKEK